MKLWQGRLSGDVDAALWAMNASIGFDQRLVQADIAGSRAHAAMLYTVGVLSQTDWTAIDQGLSSIIKDIESGALAIDMTAEDIHTFVEQVLTQRIGEAGKRLHTGRSRNDQVALDLRIWAAWACEGLILQLDQCCQTLSGVASDHLDTVMPGYTHMQRAQPVTLAHHLMAYAQMFQRDQQRLKDALKRIKISPLGAGALAGTSYPLDPPQVAHLLGFDKAFANSLDAVSDRDFALELLSSLSIIAVHLSRLGEEICLWSSLEYGFMTLPDSLSTGSSIMPQKKNPDFAELLRGKAGRVFGDLMTLLVTVKGLPLAYNKDLQEDKEPLFDAVDTVAMSLTAVPLMIQGAIFHKEKMARACREGFLNATDCADYLVGKGLPFRDAYAVVGQLVRVCADKGCTLEELSLPDLQDVCSLFDTGVYDALGILTCVKRRCHVGGPAPEAVKAQILSLREDLG